MKIVCLLSSSFARIAASTSGSMGDSQQYPIGVPQNALQAQVQAISLLESRVAGLIAQTSWPVHIPFAPKAMAKGTIVHTNDLKVNLGAGIWTEMTAAEAVQYLRRQRQSERHQVQHPPDL